MPRQVRRAYKYPEDGGDTDLHNNGQPSWRPAPPDSDLESLASVQAWDSVTSFDPSKRPPLPSKQYRIPPGPDDIPKPYKTRKRPRHGRPRQGEGRPPLSNTFRGWKDGNDLGYQGYYVHEERKDVAPPPQQAAQSAQRPQPHGTSMLRQVLDRTLPEVKTAWDSNDALIRSLARRYALELERTPQLVAPLSQADSPRPTQWEVPKVKKRHEEEDWRGKDGASRYPRH